MFSSSSEDVRLQEDCEKRDFPVIIVTMPAEYADSDLDPEVLERFYAKWKKRFPQKENP